MTNTERLNVYSTSPAKDARSPFREASQFTQDGISHGSPTKVSYQQEPEEDARAHEAEAKVRPINRQTDLTALEDDVRPPSRVLCGYRTVTGENWGESWVEER